MLVQKLRPDAILPTKGSPDSAGFDLYSIIGLELNPGERYLFPTGLILQPDSKDSYIRVAPRSGLAVKGIDVGAGVVDYDYTGEVKVLLINNSNKPYYVEIGSRVAQAIEEKINLTSQVIEYDILGNTQSSRGSNGFGSSGV
jgi:dUTP pyrophosphatase